MSARRRIPAMAWLPVSRNPLAQVASGCSSHRHVLLAGAAVLSLMAAVPATAEDRDCTIRVCEQGIRGKAQDDRSTGKLPIGENTEKETVADEGDTPFSISVDGEEVAGSEPPDAEESFTRRDVKIPRKQVDRQRKTDVALESVDIQVKFDGLTTATMLNISTAPIRRAYVAGEQVDFLATANYPDFIERAEIRILGTDNAGLDETVAVVPVAVNGTASWTMPDIEEDEFRYVLRVYDAEGRYDETSPLTLKRTDSKFEAHEPAEATAPGMGEDRTALKNIPVYGGAVTVYGRNIPEGYQVEALGGRVPIDPEGKFVTQRILPPGDQTVDVSVKGGLKNEGLQFKRDLNIPKNDWFYVALADLTVGRRFGDDGIEAVRPNDNYDKVYTKGRLAFYLKGKIKGRYLLTAAADTGEDDIENLFRGLDDKDPRQLLRRLDPDDYYPIYGDDSTAIEDAPTRGKFYVRLERGDSHVMWGNYKVNIDGTKFMSSDRGLYGANAIYKSEGTTSFGERRTDVRLYAAQPDTLPQRDEFLGTGGSAYFLQRQDITVGSETVTVEIRDATTGMILEQRTLRYGEDYDFDYMQGMLLLKRPLSSSTGTNGPVREGALGGNKVYVIAQYEYTPAVGEVDGYVYGGRAQQWIDDKVRIGVTGMHEETGEADQDALGADIRIRHSDNTFLEAEVARSKGPGFGKSVSRDGGLTLDEIGTTGDPNKSATAWRVRGQVGLEDFSNRLKGTVGGYYEEKEAGFSTLAEQVSVDKRIWGAFADVDLTPDVNVGLEYDDFEDAKGKVKRKGTGSVSWEIDEYWKVSFGLTYTELMSSTAKDPGHNGSRLDGGVRVDYDSGEDWSVYAFGQGTLSRSGDIRRNDRGGVGGEVQVTEKVGLTGEVSYGTTGFGALAAVTYEPTADDHYYLGYRLDPDRAFDIDRSYDLDGSDYGGIVVGVRRRINDIVSAYAEDSYDMYGRRRSLTQTYGVVYTPDAMWTVNGGLEIGTIEDDSFESTADERYDIERRAVSLGLGYNDEETRTSFKIKGEVRNDDSEDDKQDRDTYMLAAALNWQTSEDWRLFVSGDLVLSNATDSLRDGDYVETSIGYAYRPADNDRLNALFKYTWLYDLPGPDQVNIDGDKLGPAQRSHILSADATYDLFPWLSIGGKYGFRIGETRARDGTEWTRSAAHLGVIRTDLHIIKNWDVLLEGRVLHDTYADTTDYGALAAIYRHVGNNFKVGVGYNFGVFSDDLRDLTYDDQGVFLNVVGKF